MATLQVNAEIQIDDEDLDEQIIAAAAEKLLSQVNMTGLYGGSVMDTITNKLSEIVTARVEAMLDREIAQVDRYGGIVAGPKKSFRDVFADTAEKFFTERVDSEGRTSSEGYGRNTRLEYLIRKVEINNMEFECRKVATQFKAELQTMATAALSKVVAEHMPKVKASA